MDQQWGGQPADVQRPWVSPGPPGPPAPPPSPWAPVPAPVPAHAPPPTPPSYWTPTPTPPRRSTGRRVALLIGIVIGAAALIGVCVLGALAVSGAVAGFAADDPADYSGGGEYVPLTGKLPDRPTGPVAGETIEASVTDVLTEDLYDVQDLTCPRVPKVDQGVVTVCHGELDEEKYAVIVFFEDAAGRYTLLVN